MLVNGVELYYREVGRGPVCLVLNGGMGTDHTLLRTLDPLGDRLRLIHFDQRGTGHSGRPDPKTLTLAQVADDAGALAARLGADRVVVFGHSFGGFAAQELAVRCPDLVAGLVLVGTTPGRLGATDDPHADAGPPPPAAVTAIIASILSGPATDEYFAAKMAEIFPHYLHRYDARELVPLMKDAVYDATTFRATADLLSTWSVVDRLDQVKAPTLVLAGRHDPVASVPQSYRIARRIAGAEVAVFEQSGHFPWLDEPDEFYRTVYEWLDRHRIPALIPAGPR